MTAASSKTECDKTNCKDCPSAHDEDGELDCFNYEKMYKYNEERQRKDTIRWLTESLQEPSEIEVWKDEYDITIIPEKVEIIEILEEISYGCSGTVIFLAKLNDGEPIKIKCGAWRYPATRVDPEDSGMELEPI
jgi:hypothetical protein